MITRRPDGGAAFPINVRLVLEGKETRYTWHGMSLRDWFAGQALTGWLADGAVGGTHQEEVANACYLLADAMLAAREGKKL